MNNVSILGCGWLGLELAGVMVNEGFKLKGSVTTDKKVESLAKMGVEPFVFDWSDHSLPSGFFQCDIMIITIPPSTKNYQDNLLRFISLLEKYQISRIIYTSATSVYPDLNREVIEGDAQHIISPHSGLALLELENLLRENKSFQPTIIRFAGLYGPDRVPGKFLAGKKNLSGGNRLINLIHRDDCVQIIIKILKEEIWGDTFNASSDFHPTRKEFYNGACSKLGLPAPEFNDIKDDFKIVNSNKLKARLNYSFIHPNPMDDL